MGTLRNFNLNNFIETYNIEFLVETGTYYGDGVDYANSFNFKHIYSFEIYEPIFNAAKDRFKNNNNITILNKNSSTHLKDIDKDIQKNTLFFLDAHFPGSDAGLETYVNQKDKNTNLPLKSELEYILTRSNFHDVIIIDDMRLFVDDPQIQSSSLHDHLKSLGTNYHRRDLVHFDIFEELDKFTNYNINFDYNHEGYIILTHK